MQKFFCNRCEKEMSYSSRSAQMCVYHENGQSYSIGLSVSIINPGNGQQDFCDTCVKELTKKAAAEA